MAHQIKKKVSSFLPPLIEKSKIKFQLAQLLRSRDSLVLHAAAITNEVLSEFRIAFRCLLKAFIFSKSIYFLIILIYYYFYKVISSVF
jgi:hypothetical protein